MSWGFLQKHRMSNVQPKVGDVMLGCEHGPDILVNDVLYYPEALNVPDVGEVHYLVFCAACFERQKKEGLKAVLFTYKRVWGEDDGNVRFEKPKL
jgi:hypothetical protein